MSPIDPSLTRRRFLELAIAGAAAAAAGCDLGAPTLSEWPFTLGVASGDPLPDRVVLWTRLAPDPVAPDGRGGMPPEPFPVYWEVARDEAFRAVVRTGVAVADPGLAHSVHVDVNGLEPDRWYFYRFWAAGHVSEVGRTRTFPAPGDAPARMRFASASCQNFRFGYYTAYADMVQHDLDFVAFLGDYIYETAGTGPVRPHVGPRLQTLADYRNRYANYRSDANLRAAHARFPWIVTWDDHEVGNNYAGLLPDEHGPDAGLSPEAFAAQRAAAYLAWYEHMPARVLPPKSPSLRIYRSLAYGDLARLFVLDTRQYRSDQPCGDGLGAPCAGFPPPDGTLLGDAQERWLLDGLAASTARWDVLAQQIVFAPTRLGVALNFDQWDGYPLARERILAPLRARELRNAVVLTGDIHSAGVGWVPGDTEALADPVATELVATGISSGGLDPSTAQLAETLLQQLPHVDYFEATTRGYLLHDVGRDTWQADVRFVETVSEPVSPAFTTKRFVVERGNPAPQEV